MVAIQFARQEPRRAAMIGGAAVVALAVLGYGSYWYQHRPQPAWVEVRIDAPKRTCIECETPQINPLVLRFSASAAPLALAGKTVSRGITLTPALAGKWRWDGDKTLRFEPTEDWPVGERYTVALNRKQALAPQIQLKTDAFTFNTEAFAANVVSHEFFQDPQKVADKKVVTTLHFVYPVEPAELERRIQLTLDTEQLNGKHVESSVPFTVQYDKLKLNAYIHSAQLAVPEKRAALTVMVDKGLRSVRGGNRTDEVLSARVEVPGRDSLTVTDVALEIARNERDEPDQVLFVDTAFSVTEAEASGKVQAWVLPTQHPDPKRQKDWDDANPGKPYAEWSANVVGPEVLQASTALPLSYVANEREHVEHHGFRYQAEPGRYIYVRVERGLQSFGGYQLGKTVDRVLQVPPFPQELRITNSGALLALSGAKTLTVFSRDVAGLRVEIGRLLPDQLQHLVTQTYGSLAKPEFQNYGFDAANLTERVTRDIRLPKLAPGSAHYEPIRFGEFLKGEGGPGRGVFLLKVGAIKPKSDAGAAVTTPSGDDEIHDISDTRLIVVTDLGLLAKRAVNGAQDVFVQSIANGTPQSGVTVEIIGKNGEPVLSQVTDAEGHVRFPDLRTFQRERQPVLYLARRGGDSAFLPINRQVSPLDLSRFDVGGVSDSADAGRLAAYLFSDRGIYRPGEEIRVGAIVKSQDWKLPLAGLPLRVEVLDPRGIAVKRDTLRLSAAGFEELRYTTFDTAAAGQYAVNLYLLRSQDPRRPDEALIGSTTVKVQEFEPDRLRMRATLTQQNAEGWVSPQDLAAKIDLQNLFGTPAENRRVSATMTLTPQFPAFPAYKEFRFYDPQAAKDGVTDTLADTQTDAQGQATLALNLQRFAKATYRLHLVAQGFEADGGRGVSAEAAALVSNLPYLVGYKTDGALDYVSRGAKRAATLIAIDPSAQKTEVKGLNLARVEVRYVSTLVKQDSGVYRYESRKKELTLDSKPLTIPAAGLALALNTDAPGRYAYIVTDGDGQVFARIDYAVAGGGNLTRALDKNAELQMVLNRHDYAPGDEIELQLTAPYAGSGLITIERDRVYAWKWFHSDTTASVQKIKLPPGIEGNAYVSVSYVRDPGSDEIYASPLSYGVQPFSVNLDARRDAVTLQAPERVRPGETLTLKYKTAKPSRIVVFAVDEGILQVARYKTADPLGYFFQKRALSVSTTQILDLILPEFRADALAAAPGGDSEGALGRFLNPFKRKGDAPVAYWSGVLDADNHERELQYTVPESFNGTLRLMAVAVAPDAVGVYDGQTTVRGDFVLSPNAPATVAPGDEFEVSVGVANNVDDSGSAAAIAVSLQPTPQLEVIGPAEMTLKIGAQHESVARFKVRARDMLGAAKLRFSAKLGTHSAGRDAAMSVRPITPFETTLHTGAVTDSKTIALTRPLAPELSRRELTISALPASLSRGLTTYLNNYTYSCTEQLISKAVPALVFANRPELGTVKAPQHDTLDGLVGVLRSRQNGDGAYGLWAANAHVDEYVSVYAQHFLLESAQRGRSAPRDLIEAGNRHLRQLASHPVDTLDEARTAAYAIYLLTRQGVVMANEADALREWLDNTQKAVWPQDLTAAYLATAYQLMKQTRVAERLISPLRFDQSITSKSLYYRPLARDGMLLYLLARHFPERLSQLPTTVLPKLASIIDTGIYTTIDSATLILAFDAYADAVNPAEASRYRVAELLRGGQSRALALSEGLFQSAAYSEQAEKLKLDNTSKAPAFYTVVEAGFDRKPSTEVVKDGFEILHEYTDAAGQPVSEVKVGDELYVHLKFRALRSQTIYGAALVDLLPGGFELVVQRTDAATAPYRAVKTAPDGEASGDEESGNEGDAGEGEGNGDNEDEAAGGGEPGWHCLICVGNPDTLEYADFREDRVVFYTWIPTSIHEVVYRIKAISVGQFSTAPAYGEAMYDRTQRARTAGGTIRVIPR